MVARSGRKPDFRTVTYAGGSPFVPARRTFPEKPAGTGKADPDALTEEAFGQYLDTADVPDIDFVIRTGGNHRLSNFFPWQTVYSEIWFTDTLWPDFTKEELRKALDYYEHIQINKGK